MLRGFPRESHKASGSSPGGDVVPDALWPLFFNGEAHLGARDLRQLAAGLLVGVVADLPVLLEHLALEESESGDNLVEVGSSDVAVPGEVQLVLPDVLERESIRRPHEVADEVADAAHIALASARVVPPNAKLFVHVIAEFAHDIVVSR